MSNVWIWKEDEGWKLYGLVMELSSKESRFEIWLAAVAKQPLKTTVGSEKLIVQVASKELYKIVNVVLEEKDISGGNFS